MQALAVARFLKAIQEAGVDSTPWASTDSPRRVLRNIAQIALADDLPGPSLRRSKPSRPDLAACLQEAKLAELLPNVARPQRLSLSAGLLQIHDFWEESHEAAQLAEDLGERLNAPYWHGVAHRREPDAGNAAYWFRRVGNHSVMQRLASDIRLSDRAGNDLSQVIVQGRWDSLAFVDVCIRPVGKSVELAAQTAQAIEMTYLFDATLDAAGLI